MNKDDHAALIEVKGRLIELRAQHATAEAASDWAQLSSVQNEMASAEAMEVELLRRTEPEDEPRL